MSTESFEWNDPNLATHSSKMSNWYRCVIGSADIIRIVSKCFAVFKHTYNDGGRFRTSMCSMETSNTCPFCDRSSSLKDHKRSITYAVSVLHLTRKTGSEQPRFIGKLLAWRFGDEKKRELVEIQEITQGRGGITKVDLRIALKGTDAESEKFQKTSIKTLDQSIIPSLPKDLQERVIAICKDTAHLDEIKRQYCPTAEDLSRFLKEDDVSTSFNPDEFSNIGSDDKDSPLSTGEDPLASLV